MTLVAGIDTSTQSCTVVLRDAEDGRLVATARAPHPPTTPPVSRPVYTSDIGETAAAGAAVQAAAVLHGRPVTEIAEAWAPPLRQVAAPRAGQAVEAIRERYHRLTILEELDV